MDKLLDLLKSLFLDLNMVQKLFAKLLETLTGDAPDLRGCRDRVILLLKEGTLDDEFQRDPLGTSICLLYTLVGFLAQLDDHDHGPDVVVSSGPPDPELLAFAEALKVPVPKTGNNQGGLSALLLQLIVAELAKVLKELLDKWADS